MCSFISYCGLHVHVYELCVRTILLDGWLQYLSCCHCAHVGKGEGHSTDPLSSRDKCWTRSPRLASRVMASRACRCGVGQWWTRFVGHRPKRPSCIWWLQTRHVSAHDICRVDLSFINSCKTNMHCWMGHTTNKHSSNKANTNCRYIIIIYTTQLHYIVIHQWCLVPQLATITYKCACCIYACSWGGAGR